MTLAVEQTLKATPQALFHGYSFLAAWYGCQIVAIWALLLRNKTRLAAYVHGVVMGMLVILAALSTGSIITYEGIKVISGNIYHTYLGFVTTCFITIVVGVGVIALYKEGEDKFDPTILDFIRGAHKVSGWLLIVATRIVLYVQYVTKNPTLFIVLFFFDIGLHSIYFYLKMTKLRMEEVSVFLGKHNPETWLRRVNKESELEVYHGDYFIFADYVYRLGPVLGAHPGGFEIINESRGREVDRFIYGMEPMEMYESLPRVSHSARSIELAGLPVAKLEEAALYPKLNENTKCKITGINFYQSSKRIYTVYLRPTEQYDLKAESFKYSGYTNISELGKYFAVTIADTKTRLYTLVNFLQPRTIKLVELITKGEVFNEEEKKMLKKKGYNRQLYEQSIYVWSEALKEQQQNEEEIQREKNQRHERSSKYQLKQDNNGATSSLMKYHQYIDNECSVVSNKRHRNNCVPLLIKKYNDGQFTPAFLNGGFNLQSMLSKPRGRGLALQDLLEYPKPYNILMFSGGTGIYPYADTIDLLFKELVMDTEKSLASTIIANDPILQSKPFKDFTFTLYISVPTVEQIHPITLFQCEFLALHGKIKVYLRSTIESEKNYIFKRYPNIQPNPYRYENVLKQLNQNDVSRIFICGPTRMTKAMLVELKRLEWSPRKYFVI